MEVKQSPDVGLIAQEVEDVFPGLVFTNPTDGYKGINYSRLSTLAISAIQEVDKRLEVLREYIIETGEGLVATFKEMTVGKLNIDGDVCVDDVCITKEQFKNILLDATPTQVNQSQSNNSSDNTTYSDTSGSDSVTDPVTEVPVGGEVIPDEPVVDPVTAEDPAIEVVDTDEPVVDPATEIIDEPVIEEEFEDPAPQEVPSDV